MVRASLEIGNSNQELMEKSNRKKWKVWLAALVVFLVIIILVAAAVVLLTGTSEKDEPTAKPITMENAISGKLSPKRFNGTWVSDEHFTFLDMADNLMLHDVRAGQSEKLMSYEHPIMAASFDTQLSPDKKYLLCAFDYRKLYRYSYSARYLVLDLKTKNQIKIHPRDGDEFLDLAVWGPTNNSLFLVQNNNVFYKKDVGADSLQLSSDGLQSTVYNGVPDWVYEEEIFSSNRALWYSEDGSHLVYAKFNDTLTHPMSIPYYGQPGDPESQYVRTIALRYPKAGTANPDVSLHLVDLSSSSLVTAQLPFPTKLEQPILASVSFVNTSAVVAIWQNRVQNESTIVLCGYSCREIFHLGQEGGWVDMLRPLLFTSNGEAFFTILPKPIGDDAWRQIAMVNKGEKDEQFWTTKFLTNEANTVTDILHWDDKSGILWYMATSKTDSAVHHLYTVTLEGKVNCFTCNIEHSTGSKCLYNDVSMSKGGSFLTIICMGPQIPEVYIYSKDGKKVADWERNEEIEEFLKDKAVPTVRRMQVQVAQKPYPPAQVSLVMPLDADLSGEVKYPMLVHVYGGPEAFQVTEKWNVDWESSMVSRYNIIIAYIDGRGSGLRGNNNMFAIYKNLGTVEINDQINVTRRLFDELPYIDSERICIWGWSYGGYASAMALSRGGDTFKCAISVAPVTDWKYYDSIYTERYMGLPTPSDNIAGYAKAQLNNAQTALALNKKNFMLIHGTLDDNVHYQQSMMLSRVLQINDIQFTQMTYPDEDHGLSNVKKHLYHYIEKFLQRNLISEPENY